MMKNQVAGYEGIGIEHGNFVPAESAYQYALERMQADEEVKQEFVDWFYSGNWCEVTEEEQKAEQEEEEEWF